MLGQGQIQHANQSSKRVKVGIWGKVEFYVRGGDREDCWPRNRSILHFITQLKYTVSDNRIIIFKWYNYVPEPWQQLALKMISDQPNIHILFDLLNFPALVGQWWPLIQADNIYFLVQWLFHGRFLFIHPKSLSFVLFEQPNLV